MKKFFAALVLCTSIVGADQLVKLKIKGMSCPVCVKHVKKSLGKISGVKESTVHLKEGRAEVRAADDVKVEDLCAAVKGAGYECKADR